MGTGVILVAWALFLIWKDRHDVLKYAVVVLAALYVGSGPVGGSVKGFVDSLVSTVDGLIRNLFFS